jgi:hypothetical protein
MPARDALWRDHQRTRWLKPDAHRWIKPDASRFLKPGVAIGAVLPAFEAKYNPDQPREPAGSPEGGQWAGGAGKEGGDIAFDEPDFDLSAWLDSLFEDLPDFDLASILTLLIGDSSDGAGDFTFIIGDEPQVAVDEETTPPVLLVSDTNSSGNDNDLEPLPKIPDQRPAKSEDRTSVMKDLGRWFGRNVGKAAGAAGVIDGLGEQFDYIGKLTDAIKSYGDPPKTLEELQDAVSSPRNGYQKHHIDEQATARRAGQSESEINRRDNLVLIPTGKHFEINGYYSRPNPDLGGLSPRQYLQDKSVEERMQFGLDTLRRFKVLQQ